MDAESASTVGSEAPSLRRTVGSEAPSLRRTPRGNRTGTQALHVERRLPPAGHPAAHAWHLPRPRDPSGKHSTTQYPRLGDPSHPHT